MCADPLTHHFRFEVCIYECFSAILKHKIYLHRYCISPTHEKKSKIKRSKGGLEPLFNEKSIGLKPTLQTPEAHRCPFIIISQWIYMQYYLHVIRKCKFYVYIRNEDLTGT